MLIKRMELNNFFRFYNRAIIDFSIEKNVTVIKGENGMGKTTMLSAFYWVFYGDVALPLTINEMLNKRTRTEMKIGDLATASVMVDFSDKGQEYTFSRSQKFKRDNHNNIVIHGESELFIVNKTQDVVIKEKNYFENFIPKELRGFFFFDGERIDRLAKIDGKEEIKQAILDILGLTSLEQISENLALVKKDFNNDMKKKAKDIGLKELNQRFDEITRELEDERGNATEANKKLKQSRSIKSHCDEFLKVHNAERIKQLNMDRSRLEAEFNGIEGENGTRKSEQVQIMLHISRNFKIYLLSQYIDYISNFLEDKRKKKELPSDIKEKFVKDLIESGFCICGRPIQEHSESHNQLLKLLKTAGREELDNAYIKISSFISSNANQEIITSFFEIVNKYKQKIHELNERVEDIQKELKQISAELKNSDDSIIAAKESQREKADKDIEDALKIIAISENVISRLEDEIRKLNGKIQKAAGQDKEAKMYANCFEITDQLISLNGEIREYFIDQTQIDMDAKLKEVFNRLARKQEREPLLTKEFELKIVNKETQVPQILSTGEGQITSLSFIGALVSYAKDKPNMSLLSDFAGGDYPIVMDSPFGNLDSLHRSNVAMGIPELSSQVIVVVSSGQWQGAVADNMIARVGRIYEMKEGNTSSADSEYTYLSEVM